MQGRWMVLWLVGFLGRAVLGQLAQYDNKRVRGTFEIEWSIIDGTTMEMKMSDATLGYVSVGWSSAANSGHRQTDSVVGWISGGNAVVFDAYDSGNNGRSRHRADKGAGNLLDQVELISAEEAGGRTTIIFRKPISAGGDPEDTTLTNRMSLSWASHRDDGVSESNYREHDSRGRFDGVDMLAVAGDNGGGDNGGGDNGGGDDNGGGNNNGDVANGVGRFESPGGTFILEWEPDVENNLITFTADGASTGYVSVGFNDAAQFHSGADCLTFWVDGNGQAFGTDGSSNRRSLPTADNNNFEILEASQVGGRTKVKFTRPIEAAEGSDKTIPNAALYVFWAINPNDGSGTFFLEHTEYDRFEANLLDANGLVQGGLDIDPAAGLLLSVLVPLAIIGIFKQCKHMDNQDYRQYVVREQANPVSRLMNRMSRAVRGNELPSNVNGYGPQQTMSRQIAPVADSEMVTAKNPQHDAMGYQSSLGRMSMKLRQTIVTSRYAPKSLESGGFKYAFQMWGSRRVCGSQMTNLQALNLTLFALIAVAWVYVLTKETPADAWGYVCCAAALLVVIPATRNSIATWFLFQPFERTILYHRWIGRFTVFAGWAHTLYYVLEWNAAGILSEQMKTPKYRDGLIALIFLTIVFVTSMDIVRRNYYNFFRMLHYSFFGFYIFGCVHTTVFLIYAIITGLLYGVDLLMRYAFGLVPMNAYAVDMLPGEVVRVRFPKSRFKSYHAGQYVFLNFPSISLSEWHPYTLSSGPHQDYLEVHIKALGDHTRALLKEGAKIMNNESRTLPKVRVDGPYGRVSFNYQRYENVFLVGGGVGVTPLISVLKDLYQIDMSDDAKRKFPLSPYVKNVFFLWVVPNSQPWIWFFNTLQTAIHNSVRLADKGYPKLRIRGYVTRPDGHFQDLQEAVRQLPNYSVKEGRPNMSTVVDGLESSIGKHKKQRTAVLACGPSKLVNDTWDVVKARSGDGIRYDFHHEVFEF